MNAKQIAELDQVAAARLVALVGGDTENAHQMADRELVRLLSTIGCVETVKAFNSLEKWYA